jgi:hypothetical protein
MQSVTGRSVIVSIVLRVPKCSNTGSVLEPDCVRWAERAVRMGVITDLYKCESENLKRR